MPLLPSFLFFYEVCLTIDNALIKPSCYITQVETADDSEPLLSLLAPLGTGDYKSYWKGPENNTSVEFSIVLGGLSDVAGVAIIVSSCGYSTSDCPIVRLPGLLSLSSSCCPYFIYKICTVNVSEGTLILYIRESGILAIWIYLARHFLFLDY